MHLAALFVTFSSIAMQAGILPVTTDPKRCFLGPKASIQTAVHRSFANVFSMAAMCASLSILSIPFLPIGGVAGAFC